MHYIDKDGNVGRTHEFGTFVALAAIAAFAALFCLCASVGLFR